MAAEHEVLDGDGLLHAIGVAVEATLLEAREVEDGLAQRLRGDGARVDADAAHTAQALDDGHASSELGSLDGGVVPGRSRANHDDLVARHVPSIGARLCVTHVKTP